MSTTTEELEKFVVACQPDLETIKTSLSAFNIFNVLGVQHREIRHSNFLGWLFDPNESHQLGDVFLKDLFKLLRQVGVLNPEQYTELLLEDLSATQVYRESVHNIDILIVNEDLGFVICIENKINADFSKHQLAKYYNYVEKHFEHLPQRIYLTLTPKPSYRHSSFQEGNNYTNINYQQVVNLIENNSELINTSTATVNASIIQYVTMVRKDLTKTSIEVLKAREIYSQYKTEIDFIIKNQQDFSLYRDEMVGYINTGHLDGFIMSHNPHINVIHILPNNNSLLSLFHYPEAKSWNGDYIFSLIFFFEEKNVWMKFGFGNVVASSNSAAISKIKSELYNKMYDFDVYKKPIDKKYHFQMHPRNPEKDFTGIAGIRLFDEEDFNSSDLPFSDFFNKKFEEVRVLLIQPWVKECLEKLKH